MNLDFGSSCVFPEKKNKTQNEPPHDKTNKMTYAPSEDSDQPGHSPSLIGVFDKRSTGNQAPKVSSAKTDQTGQMPRLMWVFAGRTGQLVGFVILQLKYFLIIANYKKKKKKKKMKATFMGSTQHCRICTFLRNLLFCSFDTMKHICTICEKVSKEFQIFI